MLTLAATEASVHVVALAAAPALALMVALAAALSWALVWLCLDLVSVIVSVQVLFPASSLALLPSWLSLAVLSSHWCGLAMLWLWLNSCFSSLELV